MEYKDHSFGFKIVNKEAITTHENMCDTLNAMRREHSEASFPIEERSKANTILLNLALKEPIPLNGELARKLVIDTVTSRCDDAYMKGFRAALEKIAYISGYDLTEGLNELLTLSVDIDLSEHIYHHTTDDFIGD